MDELLSRIKMFFKIKGLNELHQQEHLSILNGCHDVNHIKMFQYNNEPWPFLQSNMFVLERTLLNKPCVGYFSISTTIEQKIIFEFIIHKNIHELIQLERELLEFLNIKTRDNNVHYPEYIYEEIDITNDNVFLVKHFPKYMYPFWNIKQTNNGLNEQVKVVLEGYDIMSSFEMSCERDTMRNNFNQDYESILNHLFSKERVEREVTQLFSKEYITRSYGIINMQSLLFCMNPI